MTILEMEQRSGLERTNIRFYEREGLLTPERRDNGYRDYSEDDLQLLLKIRLLRRLGFSVDSIRALKDGDAALDEAIARRLAAIEGQRRELNATDRVCREMQQDGASFPTLDARRYLDAYDAAIRTPGGVRAAVPESDRIQPVRCPWRRFFARMLDVYIMTVPMHLLLTLAFRANVSDFGGFLDWILGLAAWVLLIPVEAFLLSRLGTTPGKWLMGLRLEHISGRLLPFGEAAERTCSVLLRGEGLTIPFYGLWRNWKSYQAVMDGDGAEWDSDTVIIAQDFRWWRPAAYCAAYALIAGVLVVSALVPAMPVHRGAELTVEEFVENYNALARFHDVNSAYTLQSDGTFLRTSSYNVIVVGDDEEPAPLQFTVEDGYLKEIACRSSLSTFAYVTMGDAFTQNTFVLSAMAFAWSDAGLLAASDSGSLLEDMAGIDHGTRTEELFGCRLEYANRMDSGHYTSFRITRLP